MAGDWREILRDFGVAAVATVALAVALDPANGSAGIVAATSQDPRLMVTPVGPLFPTDDSECEALARAYEPVVERARANVEACSQTVNYIRDEFSGSANRPCCAEWAGSATGVCWGAEKCRAVAEQSSCLSNQRDRAVRDCRRKVSEHLEREAERRAEEQARLKKDADERATRERERQERDAARARDASKERLDRLDRQARERRARDLAERQSEREWGMFRQREASRQETMATLQSQRDAAGGAVSSVVTALQAQAKALANAILGTPIPVASGGAGAAAGDVSLFDFSRVTDATSFGEFSLVAGIAAPFASIPFTMIQKIFDGSLAALDALGRALGDPDRVSSRDVARILDDYNTAVFDPESFLVEVVSSAGTGYVTSNFLDDVVQPAVSNAAERFDRALSQLNARELLRPAPEVTPLVFPPWWTSRAAATGSSYRFDAQGVPLLRSSNGDLFDYDPVTNRVGYSRLQAEDLVAFGTHSPVAQSRSTIQWTENLTVFLPQSSEGFLSETSDWLAKFPAEILIGQSLEALIADAQRTGAGLNDALTALIERLNATRRED